MSWLYSRALVEAYSGGNSLDGEQSAPLNVMLTPQQFWRNDKMMDCSKPSLFGVTLQHLTESHGKELLTLFLQACHVRTYPLQAREQASMEKEPRPVGTQPGALLGKYDQSSSLWKMSQRSLFEDLELSLEIWPKWGSMLNGVAYLQPMLVPTTLEKESGYWLTPSTISAGRSEAAMVKRLAYRETIGRNGAPPGCLSEQVDWSKGGDPINYMTKEMMFPTPASSDGRRGGKMTENMTGQSLVQMVNTFPTPRASEYKDTGPVGSKSHKHMLDRDYLCAVVKDEDMPTGMLNPNWVEWLMGWPIGWTDLKPLEMDKSRSARLKHSDN